MKDANKTENKNFHANHRERMRKRIEDSGFEALLDHEKLEVLLFGSVPRVNTNETAHRLLERFGSFSAVLDASPSELETVKGVGRISAFQLNMFSQVATYYMKDKRKPKRCFSTIDDIGKYVTSKFINCDVEKLYVFCFDAKSSLISETLIHTGVVNSVSVEMRKIADEVFGAKAAKFVVAHNHPSGVCVPSADDLDMTLKIANSFRDFSVNFMEHFIVVDDKYRGIK